MSLPMTDFEALGATFGGGDLGPPRTAEIVTPTPAAMTRLQNIHAAAVELAERSPEVIANPEAARGLEEALLAAMADCLLAPDSGRAETGSRHRTMIMRRFYAMIESHPDRVVYAPEICKAVGVSNRTLTTCSNEALGMSPGRYLKLRQMHLAQRALKRADPLTTTVTAIATDYGFWDLGRFATAYRGLFGEPPSVTLRRVADAAPIVWERDNLVAAPEFA